MLKISDFSASNLLAGKFEQSLPELYVLQSIIENNESHFFDSVFHHCIVTFQSMQTLLLNQNFLESSFSSLVETHSKKELLLLAALFHDIGKKDTLVQTGSISKFPGHEEQGYLVVQPVLKRFDLTVKEQAWIAELIRQHGKIHELLELSGSNFDAKFKEIRADLKSFFPELCLLTWADVLGSQLLILNPDKFNHKVNFCKSFLENL
ncbi:MAG: HD domain-containing protein [Candidatus Diapherotrites archaeon]|nr:HD domain-containing protein [Candidatus Diapherotrites archaeon]